MTPLQHENTLYSPSVKGPQLPSSSGMKVAPGLTPGGSLSSLIVVSRVSYISVGLG